MEHPEREIAHVVHLLTTSTDPEVQKEAVEKCVSPLPASHHNSTSARRPWNTELTRLVCAHTPTDTMHRTSISAIRCAKRTTARACSAFSSGTASCRRATPSTSGACRTTGTSSRSSSTSPRPSTSAGRPSPLAPLGASLSPYPFFPSFPPPVFVPIPLSPRLSEGRGARFRGAQI